MKDKINKLLALSKSSNQHEAELAMKKAMELMQQHQLTHLDLIPDLEVTHTDYVKIVTQHYLWARTLASAAAMMFDCKVIGSPENKTFRFVGEAENLSSSQMMFWHLFKAWKTICNHDYKRDKPLDRKTYRKSHGLGYASALYSKACQLTEERKETINKASSGKELVVVHLKKVEEYMQTVLGSRPSKSRALTVNRHGYAQGQLAGKKMNLAAPITSNTRLLK